MYASIGTIIESLTLRFETVITSRVHKGYYFACSDGPSDDLQLTVSDLMLSSASPDSWSKWAMRVDTSTRRTAG